MGGREGHVVLGSVFCIIGLWHLYNHVKTHSTRKKYRSFVWFPTPFSRYSELYFILLGCSIFSFVELRLAPFDHDGTFKANHLHHIEHACIAMTFNLHALFAILLDKLQPKHKSSYIDMGHFLAAMAFAVELLLFHFHTTDHVGLEGQYHLLLQQVVLVCLFFTLLSIWLPKSFMVSYTRSLAVICQGLWLIIMGYMLWTPEFAPKGCELQKDGYGRDVIKCSDEDSLHRAKSLVNILFGWFVIGLMGFGVGCYWIANKFYGGNEFRKLDMEDGDCRSEDSDGFFNEIRVLPIDFKE